MGFKAVIGLIFSVCVGGCVTEQASVQTQTKVAGIGDVIIRKETRETMPNAFGKADIFGRTRSAGFSSIRFGGMQGDKVVLLRSDVVTQSNATTMNSTPTIVPMQSSTSASGMVGNTPVSGTSTTSGYIVAPARGSSSISSQEPTIPISVNWRSNPRVPAMGQMIVIDTANPNSLSYHLE